jgi:hypothetical protein
MDIVEITGYRTGMDRAGVSFLDPSDAFENMKNGYIYRQVLQSRKGFIQFADQVSDKSRIMGIFENVEVDGDTQLLVCSQDFLYSYNSGTNVFDQIPMAGAAPALGFGIASPEAYVSGTSYPTASGTSRFVFTGSGMSAIYFYDGTDVKVFTNAVDNTNFEQPAASIGNLVRAVNVVWFNERLNFFVPTTSLGTYLQGILFSGIRDTAGNGDKFNVPGSGLAQCDTYEVMQGAISLGDVMIMNFSRSNWVLEKTRDAFNPVFTRKIPSVLGTDAGFSAVSWAYEVKSMGKTGFVTTDGRKSVRFDDKIPYFTADFVDQDNFGLSYGGFDRINAQFIFSYRSVGSNLTATTQDAVLAYNYEENSFSINDQRFSVFGQTDLGENFVWNDIDEINNPEWARMDETEEIWNRIGLNASTQKTLAGDNLGFVYQINQGFNDYFLNISSISQASSAVVGITDSPFQVGDLVTFENVLGMTEINDLTLTVTAITTNSITVNVNSIGFTAYTSGGTVSKPIDFEAQMSPFNPYRSVGRKVYVSHVECLLNTASSPLYVDVYDDEEESPFKTALMVPSDTTTKAQQWLEMIVDQESNFLTFVLRNSSVGTQTIITSIRIHCSAGALTSS